MKTTTRRPSPVSSLELLEARIAPAAAVVVATLDHGKLTIAGDSGDADLTLQQIGAKLFRLTAATKTTVQLGAGGTPTTLLDLVGPVTSVDATFGIGADHFVIQNAILSGGVTIHAGDGANLPVIDNSRILGGVSIFGGTGADTATVSGFKTAIGGVLALDLGAGANATNISAHDLSLGALTVKGGSAQNNVTATSTFLKIKAGVSIDNTVSSGSSTIFSNRTASVGGAFTLLGGGGFDSFDLSGLRYSIKGDLSMTGGAGLADVLVTPSVLAVGGSVGLSFGDNPGANAEVIVLSPSASLKVGGSVNLQGGTGLYTWDVGADVTDIAGSFALTVGNHSPGDGRLTLHGDDTLRVGKALTIQQGSGAFTSNVLGGLMLQVGGAVQVTSGDHAAGTTTSTFFNSAVRARLAGPVTVHNGNGANLTALVGEEALTIGTLTVTGGASQDQVYLTGASTRLTGPADVSLGSGDAVVVWDARTRLDVAGNVHVDVSGASTQVQINAGSGLITGSVSADFHTSSVGLFILRGLTGRLQVAHDVTVAGGSTAHLDTVFNLAGVGGATSISSGAGNDSLLIDDSNFSGIFTAGLGNGLDKVHIDIANTGYAFITSFSKAVTIDLNAGNNDELFIGGAGVPSTRVSFGGITTFDGGAGTGDVFFSQPANTYKVAGSPVLAGFE